ncbi:MAG TPA: mechanosensitive ion channel family protein [Acidobacteriota bacterium]|nr:mechanosensitive ion channel family protein [Acidobacteriota bacterium]HQG91565.1 mechanosensitive ion channel family protein [Acidobacteriota bacterium]
MVERSRIFGGRCVWLAVMAVVVWVGVAAQAPVPMERPAINPGLGPKPPAVLRHTPSESWRTFWDACAAGQFVLAAHLLDLAEVEDAEQRRVGAEVSEKLYTLLRRLKVNDALVGRQLSEAESGVGSRTEAVSVFRFDSAGTSGELWLRRTLDQKTGETAWLFPRQNVSNAAVWYRLLVQGEQLAGADTLNSGLGPAPPLVHRNSPRASYNGFMDAALRGEFGEAAHYLDLEDTEPSAQPTRGVLLARRLMMVLLRTKVVVPDALSGEAFGVPEEGVPEDREVLAEIKADGRMVPLTMRLRQDLQLGNVWTFAPETVGYIDFLYGVYGHGWIGDYLPGTLLSVTFAGLQLWQWLAILLGLGAGWALAKVLERVMIAIGRVIARRTRTKWDDELVRVFDGPLGLVMWGLLLRPVSFWLSLTPTAEIIILRGAQIFSLVGIGWLLFRIVDIVGSHMVRPGMSGSPVGASFATIMGRFLKALVVVIVLLGGLSAMGVEVTGFLAGLGIGGLAVAFAAQKTIENLFGAVSIAADRPFQLGDYVDVDGVEGTVEDMGLRSVRIRTMKRTLVTIPNALAAGAKITNFSVRDRILYNPVLGLAATTSTSQLALVIDEIKRLLIADPRIFPDTIRVRFRGFGPSSKDVAVVAWVLTTDWHTYTGVAEELNFQILDIVQRAGTGFAFPTQTVFHAPADAPDPAVAAAAEAEASRRRQQGDWTLPEPSDSLRQRLRPRDPHDLAPAD